MLQQDPAVTLKDYTNERSMVLEWLKYASMYVFCVYLLIAKEVTRHNNQQGAYLSALYLLAARTTCFYIFGYLFGLLLLKIQMQ